MAIDDYYAGTYEASKYKQEILTTKNRGFTDAYLIKRPFEKNDTQNLVTSLTNGSYQVSGVVNEDEETFMCKYKTYRDEEIEIVLPYNKEIKECENEIGKIYKKDDKWILVLNKIETLNGKILDSVHSGNLNPIKLPCKLPYLTFLRKEDK